ncbi:MAG TPA: AI-2E family transporter [Terracidiphilus sp.]|jgi:predicted PurR-regulated permease PerM|nr:AI-2E family transporter [Terracidiphilus sp.]
MIEVTAASNQRTALVGDGRTGSAIGRQLSGLITMVIVAAVTVALYLGRDIFIPFALAILLSFILSPLASFLRRRQLGRVPSVILAVLLAFALILGIGGIIAGQMANLAQNLPEYQSTIIEKARSLRLAAGSSGVVEQASKMFRDLVEATTVAPKLAETSAATSALERKSELPSESAQKPLPVEVRQPGLGPLQILQSIIEPLLKPLATTGLVMIFVIFILLQREDLRDRLIRLAGVRDLQRTTKALDDAAMRVSRYLLMQTIVNTSYAVPIGIGLWLIGVPNPILWGMLAMLLRFVPYIGPIIAALFPLALSVAVDPGWTMLAWTAALFVTVELIINNLVEPWLYGSSTGLSALAIILAATFWTWLWGPIGLLLSTPLTSCVVVLGRHVPQLQFLDIAFGNRPVLAPEERFYQRMLAGNPVEAAHHAEEFLKEKPLSAYYDEVAIRGLALAQYDFQDGALDEGRTTTIKETIDELVDDLSDHNDLQPKAKQDNAEEAVSDRPRVLDPETHAPGWRDRPVLCVSSRGDLDEAAAVLLAQLLEKHDIGARVLSCRATAPERLRSLDTTGVAMVCVSYLDSQGLTHARYLVRRLRRKLPEAKILVGFWTMTAEDASRRDPIEGTGADLSALSLQQAVAQVCNAANEASASVKLADDRLLAAE